MRTHQLSCGCWQTGTPCDIGAILPCHRCGFLRTIVIGFADTPGFFIPAREAG